MSTDAKMDVSIFEKIGDGFTAFSEGAVRFLTRLLGSSNERTVKQIGYTRGKDTTKPHVVLPGSILAQVNALEPKMKEMTDEQLRELTPQYRARLAKGESLDDLLPEAFAACREAALRTKNMRHF